MAKAREEDAQDKANLKKTGEGMGRNGKAPQSK